MTQNSASQHSANEPLLKSRLVAKSPIFYGWWVLLVGTLGLAMTLPGQTGVVSIFWDYIMDDLQVERTTITLMYTIATLCASFLLPLLGKMIDARGPRFSVVVVSVAFVAACILMGTLRSAILLFVGFFFIRLLGQGSLSIVSQHAINLWFVRKRGLAIGISGIGLAVGFATIPKLSEWLILRYGWQPAYMVLGGMIACTILPLGWLIFRRHPEKYGQLPDGAKVLATEAMPQIEESNFTAQEARQTGAFWLFLVGAMNFSGLITALQLNNNDILASQNLSDASNVFVSLGLVAAAFNLLAGALLDRIQPRYMLMVAQLGLAASLLLSTQLTNTVSVYVYGGLMGMTQGITGALNAVVFANYFGRLHLGSIKGFVATMSVLASAVFPIIFSFSFQWFEASLGRYTLIVWLSALLPLTVAVLAPWIRAPRLEDVHA